MSEAPINMDMDCDETNGTIHQAPSSSTVGAKRKHGAMNDATDSNTAMMVDHDSNGSIPTSIDSSSVSKKPRLTIEPMSLSDRAALDANLALQRRTNPQHGGERVCARVAVEVDVTGEALVHLTLYTPNASTKAAAKEAKYLATKAKFNEKKAAAKARQKETKAKAREERAARMMELERQGKTKEEVRAIMRAEATNGAAAAFASSSAGSSVPRAASNNRQSREVKRQLSERMRRGNELQRVVVDCSFDHLMRMEEVCSLAKQIRYMYGANVRSPKPLHLILTSLGLPAGEQPGTDHYEDLKRAMDASIAAESTTVTPVSSSPPSTSTSVTTIAAIATPVCYTRSILQRMDGFERVVFDRTTHSYTECFPRSSLVYLTAESPNVIQQLDPSKVYIIGGIVDHNRMKGLCHDLATKAGIPTARLPIPEYLVNDKRTVITVNQVFEILLHIQEQPKADWAAVFKSTLPARSNWQERQPSSSTSSSAAASAATDGELLMDETTDEQANDARMEETSQEGEEEEDEEEQS